MSMHEALKTVWANPYVKVLCGIGVVVVAVLLFRAVHPAGMLFLAAFGLAYLANPLVDWLQGRGVRRGFGVALVVIALVAATWLASRLSISAIGKTFTEDEDGIALTEAASEWFVDLPANVERIMPDAVMRFIAGPLATFSDVLEQLGSMLAPHVEGLTGAVVGFLSGTVTSVFQVALVLILTVYVLYDFHRFTAAFFEAIPRGYRDTVRSLAGMLDTAMGGYIRGQLVIAVMVGLMVFVGLTIIGLPLAGFIGLIAGLLNIVPFLGSIVPAIPAIIIAIAGGWWQVVLVILVFVIANQIDNHVLTPLILSRSTTLHPVTVILAVIGGFAFGGLLAAILAVPVVAFAKALFDEYYKASRFHSGE
jgi:predicted PurR-regulated permease PerM